MAKKAVKDSVYGIKVGQAVSISPLLRPHDELAAIVKEISQSKILLEIRRRISYLPFDEAERVRIHYWEEGIVYCWGAEVLKIVGLGKPHVVVSIHDEGVTLQRRKSFRVPVSVPFSFTVVDAAASELIGEKVLESKTQNISVGGLKFETGLPLKVGDHLEMNFQLSPSRPTSAFGWVVRSEAILREGQYINSVAVTFLQLEEEDQIQLAQFLAGFSA